MYYLLPSSLKQSRLRLNVGSKKSWSVGLDEFDSIKSALAKCASLDESAPLLPVWRRFKGPFWDSLEFWALPQAVQERIESFALVLSPLYGFLSIWSSIPLYRLGWDSFCNGKRVKELWKPLLKEKSREIFKDKVLFDFLGAESSLLDFSTAKKVVRFEFYRKDRKVRSNAKHRAYTLRYIAERNLNTSQLASINFYDYKVEDVAEDGNRTVVKIRGEGKYI